MLMTSINKKKIALTEKYNQEKLRNLAMKNGVTLKSPETVFLSNDTKFGKNVVINPYVVIGKKTKIPRIYEKRGARWQYVVCLSPLDEFTQVSFVNGIHTKKGGKHVEYILNQIIKKLAYTGKQILLNNEKEINKYC